MNKNESDFDFANYLSLGGAVGKRRESALSSDQKFLADFSLLKKNMIRILCKVKSLPIHTYPSYLNDLA